MSNEQTATQERQPKSTHCPVCGSVTLLMAEADSSRRKCEVCDVIWNWHPTLGWNQGEPNPEVKLGEPVKVEVEPKQAKEILLRAIRYEDWMRVEDKLPVGVWVVPGEFANQPSMKTLNGTVTVFNGDWIIPREGDCVLLPGGIEEDSLTFGERSSTVDGLQAKVATLESEKKELSEQLFALKLKVNTLEAQKGKLTAEVGPLRAALRTCAAKFREYEADHMARFDRGYETFMNKKRAEANALMAEMCEKVLGKFSNSVNDPEWETAHAVMRFPDPEFATLPDDAADALSRAYEESIATMPAIESPENMNTDGKETFAETGCMRSQIHPKLGQFPIRLDLFFRNDVALRRIGETYGEGAAKYGENNWKKGFPSSVYLSHALEHIRLYGAGDRSEDHLAHASWNLLTLMWVEENKPELLDSTE